MSGLISIKYGEGPDSKSATIAPIAARYASLFIFIIFLLIGGFAVFLLGASLGFFSLVFAFIFLAGGALLVFFWTASVKITKRPGPNSLEIASSAFFISFKPAVISDLSGYAIKPVEVKHGIFDKGRTYSAFVTKPGTGESYELSAYGIITNMRGGGIPEEDLAALSDFFGIPLAKAEAFSGAFLPSQEEPKEFAIDRAEAKATGQKVTYTRTCVIAAVLGFISFVPCLGALFCIPAIIAGAWAIMELKNNKDAQASAYLLAAVGILAGGAALLFYSVPFIFFRTAGSAGNAGNPAYAAGNSSQKPECPDTCTAYSTCDQVTEFYRTQGENETFTDESNIFYCKNSSRKCCVQNRGSVDILNKMFG